MEGNVELGTIVKSNSHTDYVCQVYGPGDVAAPPPPDSYGFGTFVRCALHTDPTTWLVGLVYNTILLNPDFGRLGPRLSPAIELEIFAPDYLNEKATLIGVVAIGTIATDGRVTQGVSVLAASIDAPVARMTHEQIRAFHTRQERPDDLHLSYAPLLLGQSDPLHLHLLPGVLRQLQHLFTSPRHLRMLELLLDQQNWYGLVSPLGGHEG